MLRDVVSYGTVDWWRLGHPGSRRRSGLSIGTDLRNVSSTQWNACNTSVVTFSYLSLYTLVKKKERIATLKDRRKDDYV
jgi:hypothetical protein